MSGELNYTLKLQAEAFTGPAGNATTATAGLKSEVGRAASGVDELTRRIRESIGHIEAYQSGAKSAGEASRALGGGAEAAATGLSAGAGKAAACGMAVQALSAVVGLAYAEGKRLEGVNFIGPETKAGVSAFVQGIDDLRERSERFLGQAIAGWGILADKIMGGKLSQESFTKALTESLSEYKKLDEARENLSQGIARSQMTPEQKMASLGQELAKNQNSQARLTESGEGKDDKARLEIGKKVAALGNEELKINREILTLAKQISDERDRGAKKEADAAADALEKEQRKLATVEGLRQAVARSMMTPEMKLASLGQELAGTTDEEKRLRIIQDIATLERQIAGDKEKAGYREANQRAEQYSKQADAAANLKALALEAAGDHAGAMDVKLQRQAEHEASSFGMTPPERLKQLREEQGYKDQIRENNRHIPVGRDPREPEKGFGTEKHKIMGYSGKQRAVNPFLDNRSFDDFFHSGRRDFMSQFSGVKAPGALKNPGIEPLGKQTRKQARDEAAKKEQNRGTPRWDSVVNIEQILNGLAVA